MIDKFEFAFKTDKGRVRLSNQDNLAIYKNNNNEIIMIVADGLGGHNKGDYASKLCVDFIIDSFKKRKGKFFNAFTALLWLRYIVYKCNSYIFSISETSKMYEGMGTTVVICLLVKGKIVCVNVGDSRMYLSKNNEIKIFSEDQSYVNYLANSGQISSEEANKRNDNNVLLSALGSHPSTNQNSNRKKYEDEIILLCSDGLYHVLKDDEINEIINKKIPLDDICNELINSANKNGGPDNISVAVLRSKQ